MRINNISSTINFGVRLTRELEQGFENTKNEIRDFYGEKSQKYIEYCQNLNILKEHGNNYVVGIGYNEDSYNPYYFKIRHKDDDREYFAGGVAVKQKDGLFSFDSLKSLAITSIVQQWKDEKALEEALKPKKTSIFSRLKKKLSKK